MGGTSPGSHAAAARTTVAHVISLRSSPQEGLPVHVCLSAWRGTVTNAGWNLVMEYESWRRWERMTPHVSSDRSTRVASASSSSGVSGAAAAAPGVGALPPLGVAGVAVVPNWSGD